ncbi:MAG TPA: Ig-like domain-containing protein [Humisphaera sp.]|jgi:hypothetical protein|nr:Ig-like domain-containing protein [Humisphaera sp.]
MPPLRLALVCWITSLFLAAGMGGVELNSVRAAAAEAREGRAIIDVKGTVSEEWVNLKWNGEAIDGSYFRIDRSIDDNAFQPLGIVSGDGSSFTDDKARQDTEYHYRITRIVGGGMPPNISNVLTIRTPVAPPKFLRTHQRSASEVELTWQNPCDSNSACVEIAVSYDGVHFTPRMILNEPGAERYLVEGLKPHTRYCFRVVISTPSGVSAPAVEPCITPAGEPSTQPWEPAVPTADGDGSVPAYLSLPGAATELLFKGWLGIGPKRVLPVTDVSASPAGSDAYVFWKPANDTDQVIAFQIECSWDGVNFTRSDTVSHAETSYRDIDALQGVRNYYRVTAIGNFGNSRPSQIVWATPIAKIIARDDGPADLPTMTTVHGHSIKIPVDELLQNDIDPNCTPNLMRLASFAQPRHGTLTRESDGSLTYTAAHDYAGDDTFTYELTDKYNAISNAATVTVSVTNTPPRAQSLIFKMEDGAEFTGSLAGGGADADSDTLTYVKRSDPAHGKLTIDGQTGRITFTRDAGWKGIDTFEYCVNDGAANSNIATVQVVTHRAADESAAILKSPCSNFTVFQNQQLKVIEAPDKFNLVQCGLNAGNTGPLKTVLVLDGNPAASGRWLNLKDDGTFLYSPPAGFVGTDWFTYKLEDDHHNASQFATVFITMRPFNDALSVDDLKPGDPDAVIPNNNALADQDGVTPKYSTIHLHIPADTPRGSQVTFSINSDVLASVRYYQGIPKSKGSVVVVGEGAGASHTWTVGDEKDPPPSQLYAVGLKGTEFGQIMSTLSVTLQVQIGDGTSR